MKTFNSLFVAFLFLTLVSALATQPREVVNRADEAQNSFCDDPDNAIPLYRGYSPSGSDHFYTTDAAEMETAIGNGYTFEGDAADVFGSLPPLTVTVPLFRMFSSSIVDHFYTTSASERDNAVDNLRYTNEGIAAYVYSSNICSSIPLYRMYSGGATDHFYTTSAPERDNAVNNLGYTDEGDAAYVLNAPA